MNRKTVKRLLLSVVCLIPFAVHSATAEVDGITWTYTVTANGEASLGGGTLSTPAVPTTTVGALTIPTELDGHTVTAVKDYAFRNCSLLTTVSIPASVHSIGDSAFYNCSSLTSMRLPEGVLSINESAFAGCSSLISVMIPESVTSIEDSAFSGCSSLTLVMLPEGLTSIGLSAFHSCLSLTSVMIPASVLSVGDSAFYNCKSLTSVTISEGVTSIGVSAFRDCSSLTTVTLPDSITSIGIYSFSGCSSLASVTIPASVTSIGGWAFSYCGRLTSVTIPASVTSIGDHAFYNCSQLKDVTFFGDVPKGFASASWDKMRIDFPKEYGANWTAALEQTNNTYGSYVEIISRAGVTATAEMTTPKTMKVTYKVESKQAKVKVRAVAFKDGVRSFANVVPVKSGTDVPNGAEVTANEEHTFVWNISEDWDIDLAKVAVEILVEEGTLLPQELITIPGAPMNRADMTITRNTLSEAQAFDALLWCYAEDLATGVSTLVLVNGQSK